MTTTAEHDNLGVDDDEYEHRDEKPLRRGRRASPRILIAAVALIGLVTVVLLFAVGSVVGKRAVAESQATVQDSSAPDLSESEVVGTPAPELGGTSTVRKTAALARGAGRSMTSSASAAGQAAGGGGAGAGAGNVSGTGTGGADDVARMGDTTGVGGDSAAGRGSRPGSEDPGAPNVVLTAQQIGDQLRLRDQLQAQSDDRRRAREALAAPIQAASTGRGWSVATVTTQATPVVSSSPEGSRYTTLPSAPHFVDGGNRIVVELTDGVRAGTTVGRTGGIVWGDVVQDVRDQDGAAILIPRSTAARRTRVRCSFRAPNAGDRELDLSCDRIVLPDHRAIALRGPDGLGLAAGDLDGSTNVSAKVDDRRGRLVRVALQTAAMSAIPVAVSGTNQNILSSANPGQVAASNAAASINETAARVNQMELTVPPTMYVEAHRRVAIHVDDPIPLDPYQEP